MSSVSTISTDIFVNADPVSGAIKITFVSGETAKQYWLSVKQIDEMIHLMRASQDVIKARIHGQDDKGN